MVVSTINSGTRLLVTADAYGCSDFDVDELSDHAQVAQGKHSQVQVRVQGQPQFDSVKLPNLQRCSGLPLPSRLSVFAAHTFVRNF